MSEIIKGMSEEHQKLLWVFDVASDLGFKLEIAHQSFAGNLFESRDEFINAYTEDGDYVLYDENQQLLDLEDFESNVSTLILEKLGVENLTEKESEAILDSVNVSKVPKLSL